MWTCIRIKDRTFQRRMRSAVRGGFDYFREGHGDHHWVLKIGDFPEVPSYQEVVDGKLMDVYQHELQFNLDKSETNNVGIAYVAALDAAAAIMSSVGTSSFPLNFSWQSPVDSLLIFANGNISSTSLEKENIGTSESRKNRWITTNVPNIIQDFRILKEFEAIPLNFDIIEKDLFPNLDKDLRGNYLKLKKTSPYFSPIHLSRDRQNNCRFFFCYELEENAFRKFSLWKNNTKSGGCALARAIECFKSC